MITTQNILLALCILLSGLIAGLLYSYSCSVNPGLNKLSDAEYLKAMQSINKAIQNPAFFLSFIGTLIILPLTIFYAKAHASTYVFYFLIAACFFYIAGVVAVTAFGNIPLNNSLDAFKIQAANSEAISNKRKLFEAPWNRYHLIRTVCSVIANIFSILALLANNAAANKIDI